jgi:hypothetical protein
MANTFIWDISMGHPQTKQLHILSQVFFRTNKVISAYEFSIADHFPPERNPSKAINHQKCQWIGLRVDFPIKYGIFT